MKKIIAVICILLMVLATSSCSLMDGGADYAKQVVSLKAESTLIKSQYERVYSMINDNRDSFTESEQQQLDDIHFAFSEAALRIEGVYKNPETIMTPAELKSMYELAYIGYTNAKDIIVTHKELFTSYQWSQLENFDKKAIDYDKQVRAVLDNPDTDDINMTIGLIITLGGAAYKYLLPVIVSMI